MNLRVTLGWGIGLRGIFFGDFLGLRGIFFGDFLGDDLVNNGVADDVGKDQCDYDGTDDGNGSELGCDHACKGSADNGDKGSNLDSELVAELGGDDNSKD